MEDSPANAPDPAAPEATPDTPTESAPTAELVTPEQGSDAPATDAPEATPAEPAPEAPAEGPAPQEDKPAEPAPDAPSVPEAPAETSASPTEEPAAEPVPTEDNPAAEEPAAAAAEDTPPAESPAPAEDAPSGGDGTPGTDIPAEDAPKEDAPADEPAAPADDAAPPADDTPIKVIAADPYAPIFGGKSGPHPEPDIAEEDKLPHPALTMTPGFIAGTTQETQGALPVPGDAHQAMAAAAVLSGTATVPTAPASEPAPEPAPADAPAGAPKPAPASAPAGEANQVGEHDDGSVPNDAEPPPAVPDAAPTAALVTPIFDQLSKDGEAVQEALEALGKAQAQVLILELKALANFAVSLSQRLQEDNSDIKREDLPESFARAYTAAQELISTAHGLFEAEPDDVLEAYVPDADQVVGDLGLGDDEESE